MRERDREGENETEKGRGRERGRNRQRERLPTAALIERECVYVCVRDRERVCMCV